MLRKLNRIGAIVGLLALGLAAPAAAEALAMRAIAADAATQARLGNHWSVYLEGEIDAADPGRLETLIATNRMTSASIYLDSPGGSLSAAMEIARLIRRNGFWTHVGSYAPEASKPRPGRCVSACVLAYAGGRWRFLHANASLGVHRFKTGARSRNDLVYGQVISGNVTEFLAEMGVDAALFTSMSRVSNSEMRIVSRGEAIRWHLVNDGVGEPQWSVEAVPDGFYLRGEQDSWRGAGKVVLTCQGTEGVIAGFFSTVEAQAIVDTAKRVAIRVDGEILPAAGEQGLFVKDGQLVSMTSLDAAQLSRLRTAKAIGFAYLSPNPDSNWSFVVDVGNQREALQRYFSSCLGR